VRERPYDVNATSPLRLLDIQVLPTFASILAHECEVFNSVEKFLIRLFCPEVSRVRYAVNEEGSIVALVILHPASGWLCTVSSGSPSVWYDFEELMTLVQDDKQWKTFIDSWPTERMAAIAEVLHVVSD
jgi:hypothetical protein